MSCCRESRVFQEFSWSCSSADDLWVCVGDNAVLPSWACFCVFITLIFVANHEDTISERSESQLQSLVLPFIPKVKAGKEGQLLSLHAEALL